MSNKAKPLDREKVLNEHEMLKLLESKRNWIYSTNHTYEYKRGFVKAIRLIQDSITADRLEAEESNE